MVFCGFFPWWWNKIWFRNLFHAGYLHTITINMDYRVNAEDSYIFGKVIFTALGMALYSIWLLLDNFLFLFLCVSVCLNFSIWKCKFTTDAVFPFAEKLLHSIYAHTQTHTTNKQQKKPHKNCNLRQINKLHCLISLNSTRHWSKNSSGKTSAVQQIFEMWNATKK